MNHDELEHMQKIEGRDAALAALAALAASMETDQ